VPDSARQKSAMETNPITEPTTMPFKSMVSPFRTLSEEFDQCDRMVSDFDYLSNLTDDTAITTSQYDDRRRRRKAPITLSFSDLASYRLS
jgi:hypothetical protein